MSLLIWSIPWLVAARDNNVWKNAVWRLCCKLQVWLLHCAVHYAELTNSTSTAVLSSHQGVDLHLSTLCPGVFFITLPRSECVWKWFVCLSVLAPWCNALVTSTKGVCLSKKMCFKVGFDWGEGIWMFYVQWQRISIPGFLTPRWTSEQVGEWVDGGGWGSDSTTGYVSVEELSDTQRDEIVDGLEGEK